MPLAISVSNDFASFEDSDGYLYQLPTVDLILNEASCSTPQIAAREAWFIALGEELFRRGQKARQTPSNPDPEVDR